MLFFDFAGMSVPDQLRAQDAALQFVGEKLTASDLVQVMSFASGIRIDQEFTDDRVKLTESIRKFRIGEGLMPSVEGAIGPDGTCPEDEPPSRHRMARAGRE